MVYNSKDWRFFWIL